MAAPLRHPPFLLHPWETPEPPEKLLLLRREPVSKLLYCQHLLNERVYLPTRHKKIAEKMPELPRQVRSRHWRATALLL